MANEPCARRKQLADQVEAVLADIVTLTTAQLAAFHQNDNAEMMELDKRLENAVGLKERSIGALRQHEADHGCA